MLTEGRLITYEYKYLFNDVDENIIASIIGNYRLIVDNPQGWWFKTVNKGVIELGINGEQEVEDFGIRSVPILDSVQNSYVLQHMEIVSNNKKYTYPMNNTYKIFPVAKNMVRNKKTWQPWGFKVVFNHEDRGVLDGFVFELNGPQNSVLEDILLWFPGMPKDYFRNNALYSYNGNLEYLNVDEIQWQPLSLPMTLDSRKLFLYFPITPDIAKKINKSRSKMMPYYSFSDNENGQYYIGGNGEYGRYYGAEDKLGNYIIKPESVTEVKQ